jgi:hypothetical protein
MNPKVELSMHRNAGDNPATIGQHSVSIEALSGRRSPSRAHIGATGTGPMSVFAVMPAPEGVLANRPGAAAIGREPARIGVGRPQTAQLGHHWLGQRDAPLFVAFADDPQHSLAVIDIAPIATLTASPMRRPQAYTS